MVRSFADELTIDPETGLPALPDGYVWEVSRGGDRLYVALKTMGTDPRNFWEKILGKEPTVWFNEYIDGDRYWEYVPSLYNTPQGILHAATSIYSQIHDKSVRNDKLDALVGLYPPKSIL